MLFMDDLAADSRAKIQQALARLPDLTFGESVDMTSRLPFHKNIALALDQFRWQVRDFDQQDIALPMHQQRFFHRFLLLIRDRGRCRASSVLPGYGSGIRAGT